MSTKLIPVISSLHIIPKVEEGYVHRAGGTFIHRHCRGISTPQQVWREHCVNMGLVNLCFPLLSSKIFVLVEGVFPSKQCLLDPMGFIIPCSIVCCNERHLIALLLCLEVTLCQDFTVQYQILGSVRLTAQEGLRPPGKCSHHCSLPILLEQRGWLAPWMLWCTELWLNTTHQGQLCWREPTLR